MGHGTTQTRISTFLLLLIIFCFDKLERLKAGFFRRLSRRGVDRERQAKADPIETSRSPVRV